MQHLVYLNIAKNKIKGLSLFTGEEAFPNLKWLDASNNKYTELPALKLPKLEYLDISYNKIEKVNEGWTGHANIRILKSIDNKFKNLAPFKIMPKLEELYLANNAIANLTGWENLSELRILHLRRNKIEKIEEEMPPLEKLEYLNLRANKIGSLDQIERLYVFAQLSDLNVINNPVEQTSSSFNVLLADVLAKRPKMVRFCKHRVTEANLLEAVHLG
jgi:Leucine-rich repeat (LRR) protein